MHNLAKFRKLEDSITNTARQLAQECRKLTETDDVPIQQEKRDEIESLIKRLRNLKDQREPLLQAISANRESLRSQVSRIRETFRRLLREDQTLRERLRTLFREQEITIVLILTALWMTVSTIMLAITWGCVAGAPSPAPKRSGGVKEWVKKHLKALGRVLAKFAGKAAAALPGIIGSVVSWLLSTLGKTKKVREKSRECHNHKPQPIPNPKRKKKSTSKQAQTEQTYEKH